MVEPLPCIRCNQCETVCPVSLHPQFLHAAIKAQNWEKVENLQLDACLLCKACTMACPSGIPLQDQFSQATITLKKTNQKKAQSLILKERFEARENRLARKERLRKQPAPDDKQAIIAAALARAQWKYDDA